MGGRASASKQACQPGKGFAARSFMASQVDRITAHTFQVHFSRQSCAFWHGESQSDTSEPVQGRAKPWVLLLRSPCQGVAACS